jgi:hypothetical protein
VAEEKQKKSVAYKKLIKWSKFVELTSLGKFLWKTECKWESQTMDIEEESGLL